MPLTTARSRAAARRSSSLVIYLFVIAVLFLAIFNEPFLVSRVQHISISSFSTAKKDKDIFRMTLLSFTLLLLFIPVSPAFPDFNKYLHTLTLSPTEFGLGQSDRILPLCAPLIDATPTQVLTMSA